MSERKRLRIFARGNRRSFFERFLWKAVRTYFADAILDTDGLSARTISIAIVNDRTRPTNQLIPTKGPMKYLTKALVGALVLLVPIFGMGCEEESKPPPPPPPPPPVCELPFGDTACVAVDSAIYPVTADFCKLSGKKPYFCRQDPDFIECDKTERDGMWCCCDSAQIGCDAKVSPPKDPDPKVCIAPPAGAVCVLLESTGYPDLGMACTMLNTMLVPYFCSEEPKQEASCKPHPDPLMEGIWCCCNPKTDMFCEAHLAP